MKFAVILIAVSLFAFGCLTSKTHWPGVGRRLKYVGFRNGGFLGAATIRREPEFEWAAAVQQQTHRPPLCDRRKKEKPEVIGPAPAQPGLSRVDA